MSSTTWALLRTYLSHRAGGSTSRPALEALRPHGPAISNIPKSKVLIDMVDSRGGTPCCCLLRVATQGTEDMLNCAVLRRCMWHVLRQHLHHEWCLTVLPDSQSSRCLLPSMYGALSQQAGQWVGNHPAHAEHSLRAQGCHTPHSTSPAAAKKKSQASSSVPSTSTHTRSFVTALARVQWVSSICHSMHCINLCQRCMIWQILLTWNRLFGSTRSKHTAHRRGAVSSCSPSRKYAWGAAG